MINYCRRVNAGRNSDINVFNFLKNRFVPDSLPILEVIHGLFRDDYRILSHMLSGSVIVVTLPSLISFLPRSMASMTLGLAK
jgi:hypothetical protein